MKIEYFYKTKQEIAIHQLERAISLFIDEQDFICSITLAGAAEEIFGKILAKNGKQSHLKEYIELYLGITNKILDLDKKEKDVSGERNKIRNELKHLCNENDVLIINSEAKDMIDRAINNMLKLNINPTLKINSFISIYWK